MKLPRPGRRTFVWAAGILAFAGVFVAWRVLLVAAVDRLQADIGRDAGLLRRMTVVTDALHRMQGEAMRPEGSRDASESAQSTVRAALRTIESDEAAGAALLGRVRRIQEELDVIDGLRGEPNSGSRADDGSSPPADVFAPLDRAHDEARSAIGDLRAGLSVTSLKLADKWKQVNLLGVVAALMAVALGCVVYALRGALIRSREAEEHGRALEAESSRADRLAVMGEMAAGLAHQLNQPLASIHTYLAGCRRRLQEAGGNHAAIVDAMEEAQSEARRASSIVERIRTFVSGNGLRPALVLVNELIQEARILVAGELRSRHVRLSLLLADDLPLIHGDRIHLEQVLVNVVRNAVEAMKSRRPEDRVLTIRTSRVDGNEVEVAVADTGGGLTPDQWKHLFEPFHTSKPGGLGLGLAISRRIVEAHGGRIWIEPNRGFGITVRFRLPCAKEKARV